MLKMMTIENGNNTDDETKAIKDKYIVFLNFIV